jgi:hypothetical protein
LGFERRGTREERNQQTKRLRFSLDSFPKELSWPIAPPLKPQCAKRTVAPWLEPPLVIAHGSRATQTAKPFPETTPRKEHGHFV